MLQHFRVRFWDNSGDHPYAGREVDLARMWSAECPQMSQVYFPMSFCIRLNDNHWDTFVLPDL